MSKPTIPPNIQRFNSLALVVFARLYEAFPKGVDLDAIDTGIAAIPEDPNISASESFEYFDVAYDVVEWLAREGFLTYENPNHERKFYNARLTMKGLVILGHVPSSLQPGESSEALIDKMKKVLKAGGKIATAETAKALVSKAFSLALSSGAAAPAALGVINV